MLAHSRARGAWRQDEPAQTLDDRARARFDRRSSGRSASAQVDLKWHGYEAATVEAIRRHGLVDRVARQHLPRASLRGVAALEPRVARGITYPFDRQWRLAAAVRWPR